MGILQKHFHNAMSVVAIVMALGLAACEKEDPPLPGKRIAIVEDSGIADAVVSREAAAEGANIGTAQPNPAFLAPGVTARHGGGHLAAEFPLERAFTVKVGIAAEDATDMAQPVADGRAIYTVTPGGIVVATALADGARLWEVDIDPSPDKTQTSVSGGLGLDAGGDILLAHAGKDRLVALDTANGAERWSVQLADFLIGGPTVGNGAVIVTDVTGRSTAFSLATGEPQWNRIGAQDATSIAGAAAPAIAGNQLVIAGADGALNVLNLFDGGLQWGDNIAPRRLATALDAITDITAHPVHDGGRIYVVTQSGVMVAYGAEQGRVLWDIALRAVAMPWLAGETLIVTTVNNELVALRRADGAARWRVALPGKYGHNAPVNVDAPRHTSPIVVAGKVLVAGDEGHLLVFDADSGSREGTLKVGAPVTTAPGAVEGSVFVLDRRGVLHVWR